MLVMVRTVQATHFLPDLFASGPQKDIISLNHAGPLWGVKNISGFKLKKRRLSQ
jgi:hypothetical protein